jgi:hypothetical protein
VESSLSQCTPCIVLMTVNEHADSQLSSFGCITTNFMLLASLLCFLHCYHPNANHHAALPWPSHPPTLTSLVHQATQEELHLLRQQRDSLEDQVQRYEWAMRQAGLGSAVGAHLDSSSNGSSRLTTSSSSDSGQSLQHEGSPSSNGAHAMDQVWQLVG